MNAFFDGLAGADEVELHAAAIRPVFERPRLKLGAVIHRDGARAGRALEDPIQGFAHRVSGHSRRHLQYRAGATPLIDHGQNPKGATVSEGIMHEVHAPPFPGTRGAGGGAPGRGDVWGPRGGHPAREPVEPIGPADALAIHAPALPAQHDPDSEVPKPRPRMGQLPDPEPERGLLPRPASAIPR